MPIALGRDVPPETTRAVLLDGAERVVWRAADGMVQIWEDRCPHRGMRLSLGFVRGNALNCLYHGWEYSASGPCVRIPAHPDLAVPPTIRANAYPVREAGGMIWTGTGDFPVQLFPDAMPVASLAIDAPATAVLERLGAPTIPEVQLASATLEGIALQIGWHVAGETKTMLHAVAPGPVDVAAALATLRRLRRSLETRVAA